MLCLDFDVWVAGVFFCGLSTSDNDEVHEAVEMLVAVPTVDGVPLIGAHEPEKLCVGIELPEELCGFP